MGEIILSTKDPLKNGLQEFSKRNFGLTGGNIPRLLIPFFIFFLPITFFFGEELEINNSQDTAFLGPDHLVESVTLKSSDNFSQSQQIKLLSERYTLEIPELQGGRIFRRNDIPDNWEVNPKIYDRLTGKFIEAGENLIISYNGNPKFSKDDADIIKIVVKIDFEEFTFQKTDYMAIEDSKTDGDMGNLYKDIPTFWDIPLGIVRVTVAVQEEFLQERECRILLDGFWNKLGRNQWRQGKAVLVSLWSLVGGEGKGHRITELEEIYEIMQRNSNDFWDMVQVVLKDIKDNTLVPEDVFSLIKKEYGFQEENKDWKWNRNQTTQNDNYLVLIDNFSSEKIDHANSSFQDFTNLNIGVIRIDTTPNYQSYLTSEMGYLKEPFIMNLRLGKENSRLQEKLAFRVLCNVEYGGEISEEPKKIDLPESTTAIFYHGRKE